VGVTVKAMEGAFDPGARPEEPPGVRGAERREGGGGNWGGPPRPAACELSRRSVLSYNRPQAGKGNGCREGVGGGHMYRSSRADNRTAGDGKGRYFVHASRTGKGR
jgi:hypothetical protein